mgnify:CR=1 FL=1
MAGQGSTGNVIAAVCSFFIPGLGQLVQGRLLRGADVVAASEAFMNVLRSMSLSPCSFLGSLIFSDLPAPCERSAEAG